MPTARPFARNTGAPIAGTIQVGNLAVGVPTAGFAATGLPWWNGPDEDLGYVIATQVAANNQPTPVPPSVTASVGFWRSTALTDASFIDLAEYVSRIAGSPQTFVDGAAAKTWLNNNGYWTSYASQIVTSGLVLNLDAGNSLSYPGTGTTWFDISGNGNNGTLTNGPTFNSSNGGSIVFDGTNDYVTTPYMFPSGNLAKSFSVWINANLISQPWIVGGGIDNSDGRAFGLFLNSTPIFHGNGPTYDMPFNGTINASTWYNVSISYNGSVISGYLNGQLNNTKAVILDTYPSPPTGVSLGVNGIRSSFAYFNGKIAQAMMYNKALSAAEVLQNFNATKSRFGL